MQLSDSTKRLIRRALDDLRGGCDVTIVAFPHDKAVMIARTVCKIAREKKVECANIPECNSMGPRVRVREYDAEIPWPTPKSKVHIDVSACFERCCFRPDRVRTVIV